MYWWKIRSHGKGGSNKIVQLIRKEKIKIKNDAKVTIQNIVASVDLGGRIHLQ